MNIWLDLFNPSNPNGFYQYYAHADGTAVADTVTHAVQSSGDPLAALTLGIVVAAAANLLIFLKYMR